MDQPRHVPMPPPPAPQATGPRYRPPTHPQNISLSAGAPAPTPRCHAPDHRDSGVIQSPLDMQQQQHHQQPPVYHPQQQQQRHHRGYNSVYGVPFTPPYPYYGPYGHAWPNPPASNSAPAQPPPLQSPVVGPTPAWPGTGTRTRARASSRASSAGNSSASSTSPGHEGGPNSDAEPDYRTSGNPGAGASESYFFPLQSQPVPADSGACSGGGGGSGLPEELPSPQSIDDSIGGGGQRAAQSRASARHQLSQQQQQQDSASGGSRAKRRPNNPSGAAEGQLKFRKNGHRSETYVLRMLDDEDEQEELAEGAGEGDPLFTLDDEEYRNIFAALGNHFCATAYRWLALYKFKIPRKRNMRDHLCPNDRELTEYVNIIKSLVEVRDVPRYAVRDERINELISIMEGASEIRHVNIHVSRKKKPDRRVLGFIAAVNEFCWLLGDQSGVNKTHRLYIATEALTLERRGRLREHVVVVQQQKAAAEKPVPPPQQPLPADEERPGRRKSTSPAQSPERSNGGA